MKHSLNSLSLLGFLILCLAIPTSLLSPVAAAPVRVQESSPPQADSAGKSDHSGDSEDRQDEDEDSEAEGDQDGNSEDQSDDQVRRSRRRNRRGGSNDNYSKRSEEFISIFKDVTASAAASTVRISDGSRDIALGAIVDSDGYILTKASELKGDIKIELNNGSSYDAEVYGIDPDTDLALLRIDAKELPAINWSDEPSPTIGKWVATPDGKGGTLTVGVVSVDVRRIPPGGGFLGILPAESRNGQGVRISQVTAGKPAAKAGLLVNDIILKIDDEDIPNTPKLRDVLKNYSEGDLIDLTIQRGDAQLVIPLRLSDSRRENPMYDRSNTQNSMGSTLSRRRLDFPKAFQHDSQLQARDCGGPIVDLAGRVVGVNIARGGRVKTFALPVDVVIPVVEQLKTGQYRPEIVNSERIADIDERLKQLDNNLVELPKRKQAVEQALTEDQARQEELERMLKEMQARLDSLREANEKNEAELESIKGELENSEATREQLQREREQLLSGKK